AAAALAPHAARRVSRRTLVVGMAVGLVLTFGYLFQTAGLLFTTPTNSGLITGLFVVFTPLANLLFFRRRPSRLVLVAVVLSLLGMVLFAGGGPDGANRCDLLTMLCAAALGLHIALLSRCAAGHDASGLAFVQMVSMALVFGLLWPLFESVAFPPREAWISLVATALVASAGAFWAQTFVQQRLPAARAAVILTTEPVFAALFGYWLAGGRLVLLQIFGAALILSALAASEVVAPLFAGRKKHLLKGGTPQ
ncbi:MAG TPA: DMT family transporter, partial [Rubrobacteraceae bacterium]|nr:DMT family transporter [Rubrobacteraceae bacterium]